MKSVTPKAGAKYDLLFNKLASGMLNTSSCLAPALGVTKGGFVEHLSGTYVPQQSVTKIITLMLINLVTPKARAKHEYLFNKPASNS
jgi:hypothetical protein